MSGEILGDVLSKRIKELANDKGWNKETLAEKSNLSYDTIKNLWYGKTPDPKLSTVLQISEAFGITVNCLVGRCTHTQQEKDVLNHYRACGEHGKAVIDIVAKSEAISAKASRESRGRYKIPCIVPSGEISKGIVYDTTSTIDIETSVKEAHIALQLTTNDLVPYFCKGDILLFENRFPHNGEYGAFYINGRVYIRRYVEENNQYVLQCLHSKNSDIIYKRLDKIDYLGACIDIIRT